MTTATNIAATIDFADTIHLILENLLLTNRGVTVIAVIATKFFLEQLIAELEALYHIEAVKETNFVIGNGATGFEVFTGLVGTQPLAFNDLRAIYNTVVGLDGDPLYPGCDGTDLACLVDATIVYSQLNEAVKARIIIEVQNILPSYNPNDTVIAQELQSISASELYSGIPFKYDRQGTANYAVMAAINNFESIFPAGNGNLTSTVQGTVGGAFNNYSLEHSGISTGSAIFISEALYSGGKIPMEAAISPATPCETLFTDGNTGRRVCCGDTNGATYSWKAHQGIVNYFTTLSEDDRTIPFKPIVGITQAQQVEALKTDTIFYAHTQTFKDLLQATGVIFPALAEIDLNSDGTWQFNNPGPDYLYNLFSTGAMADIKTGDYIFIDQETLGAHGFIIVGWGLAKDLQSGINAEIGVNFSTERQNNGVEIPYVTDFAYGYNSTANKTGFLQDIRPRPFYLSSSEFRTVPLKALTKRTNASNPFTDADYLVRVRGGYSAFTYGNTSSRPVWRFFRMPDTVRFTFARLYNPPCEA